MANLRTLRILLLLALPYLILAAGAEFLHHHGHEDCAACAWAGTTLSNAAVQFVISAKISVSAHFEPIVLLHSADLFNSASPRAPPVG